MGLVDFVSKFSFSLCCQIFCSSLHCFRSRINRIHCFVLASVPSTTFLLTLQHLSFLSFSLSFSVPLSVCSYLKLSLTSFSLLLSPFVSLPLISIQHHILSNLSSLSLSPSLFLVLALCLSIVPFFFRSSISFHSLLFYLPSISLL